MEYVESLNGSPTIILINGQQLTEYIYDYGLGLQTEKVLKIMKWIWTTGMQWIMLNGIATMQFSIQFNPTF